MFPRLFELGPFTLHTYGLLLATAFLTAITVLARLAEREGLTRNRAWDLGFVVIISALLGAKLLMILPQWSYYAAQPSRLLSIEFWQAGGTFFGGLIGATLGSFLYLRRFPDLDFWRIADSAAPAIALGQAIGRVGCFSAGCDYGTPSSLPWAVTFTDAYAGANVGVPLGIALHPAQLYESLGTLLLFLLLLWLHRRRGLPGTVIFAYFIGYGLLRFVNEFFRGDQIRDFVGELLSLNQMIALGLILLGALWYLQRRRLHFPNRG